jgi:hypothetical protein
MVRKIHLKKHLRLIAQLSALLLCLNTTITAAAYSMSSASEGKFLLCTTQGLKWVDASKLSEEAGGAKSKAHIYHCPLCAFNHHTIDKMAVDTALTLTLLQSNLGNYHNSHNTVPIPSRSFLSFQSRAPPIISL